jgi:L(+)-tartrate dehydratase beta subunit
MTSDQPAARRRLVAPLDEITVRSLRVGEEVLLDGVVWGVRDASLIRMIDDGQAPPVSLKGAAILHTAPSVRQRDDGTFEPLSVGTTTSMRMDRFTYPCLERGVRVIIGKGGLSETSCAAFRQLGGVYMAITGGAASYQTTQIEAIAEVHWLDLMPECLWKFRVRDFGPLFVAMDSHGGSAYRDVAERAAQRAQAAYRRLGL